MKSAVFVISLSSNRSNSSRIEDFLKKNGIASKTLEIKKCVLISDMPDYTISSKNISPVEKNYLKDEKKEQAAIIAFQKPGINKVIEPLDNTAIYFIEDDFSPESFYIKKMFFQKRIPFFSFGFLDNSDSLVINSGSLDIGTDLSLLNDIEVEKIDFDSITMPDFNGLIAIESPPDSIPVRYLFHFRSPHNIVKSIISLLDKNSNDRKHSPVLISNPVKPHDSYSISTRALQLEQHFKKRAEIFNDFSELPEGTTVLTWSTKRFFTLLSLGLRPVPMTRCLALWTFPLKNRKLNEMILKNPSPERIRVVKSFINSRTFDKISLEKTLKKP